MLVVQNRLVAPIVLGQRIEQGFTRATGNMKGLRGFISFKLLRVEGSPPGLADGQILYIAQTTWQDREAYEAWRESDAFSRAHAGQGGEDNPLKSSLEIFEVVLETV